MGRMGAGAGAQFDKIVRVYLEGQSDVGVLKDWWFAPGWDDSPFVEFRGPGAQGGGCKWVVAQVHARVGDPSEPPCFGFVDRDALANDPVSPTGLALLDLFLDPADGSLPVGTPLGDRIYVLQRWELENYLLLDLDTVFKEAVHAPVGTRPASADELGARFIQDAEWLLVFSAGVIHARMSSAEAPAAAFGKDLDAAALRALLQSRYPDPSGNIPTIEAKLAAFRASGAAPVREQWSYVQRIVDGKQLLQRFTARTMGRNPNGAWEEFAGRLAERHLSSIPDEIVAIVADVRVRGLAELRNRAAAATTP